MTSGLHFVNTLVLSATLQLGAIVLLLGIMTVWRTAQSEYFWPAVGLLSVAAVIATHTFYRFAFSTHDLCWLNCLGSAGALSVAAVFLALMINRQVGMTLPGPKSVGLIAVAVCVVVIAIDTSLEHFQAIAEPTPETAFLFSAVLALCTAAFTFWLDRTVTILPTLHWGLRGVAATAGVVTIGALSQLVSVQIITGVVAVAITSIGIAIYSFHQESFDIVVKTTQG